MNLCGKSGIEKSTGCKCHIIDYNTLVRKYRVLLEGGGSVFLSEAEMEIENSKGDLNYGVMRTLGEGGGTLRIWTTTNEFKSHRFVGIGASKPMVWKTVRGAESMARRVGGTVFPIVGGVMNFEGGESHD